MAFSYGLRYSVSILVGARLDFRRSLESGLHVSSLRQILLWIARSAILAERASEAPWVTKIGNPSNLVPRAFSSTIFKMANRKELP